MASSTGSWPITERAGLAQRLAEAEQRLAELAPPAPSLPPSPSWRLRDLEREQREQRRAVLSRLLEEASPSEFERIVGPLAPSARRPPAPGEGQGPGGPVAPPTKRTPTQAPEHVERAVQVELAAKPAAKPARPTTYRDAVAACRTRIVTDALQRAGGNKARAARELGLTREGLYGVLRAAGRRA
jgi:DNA-binding NtrC family response regulator